MNSMIITQESIDEFRRWLHAEEREEGTIAKYIRDVKRFSDWLCGRELTKELLTEYKEHLTQNGFAPTTINSMLAAINTYCCRYLGLTIRVKFLRVQRRLFREESRELERYEYERLIAAAKSKKDERLALLIETIGATGIRVSEVKYITIEAARAGRTQISMKGKIRVIQLNGKLCKKLLRYAKEQKIASGEIFITKSGKSMSRNKSGRR